MEEESKEILVQKKSFNPYLIISTILFIAVISASSFLYLINKDIENKINESNSNISNFTNKIDTLKNSNEVVAYDIIKSNKKDIEMNIDRSKVSKYMTEFINVSKKYKMLFTGFTFDWKKVNTQAAYINKNLNSDAMDWVIKFIEEFRDWKNDTFNLDPVFTVSWDTTKRAFTIGFNILK